MASSANFTLDDNEEAALILDPVSSVPPVAATTGPLQALPTDARPPTSSFLAGGANSLSFQLQDMPKLQLDTDLGVSTLAQAAHVLQENQQRIEETEAQLQALMRRHAKLVVAEQLLEQQKVLDVLSTGPQLGYDRGRPVASLLVYRCCLRWGCFSGDFPAAAVLENLSALMLVATDEDAILARTMSAARARAGISSGGALGENHLGSSPLPLPSWVGADAPAEVERAAVEAATREVAYWLAVTSILLAMVNPHLPLPSLSRGGAGGSASGAAAHGPTPLAAVAGDARASVARAASAAAAKVQELKRSVGTTITDMLGRGLLNMRRRGKGESAAAQQSAEAGSGVDEQHEQQQQEGQGSEAATGGTGTHYEALPPVPPGAGGGRGGNRKPAPTVCVPEPHATRTRASTSAPVVAAPTCASAAQPPQLAFRQQLDLLVQKTYMQMRDSLKRHVSAVLPGCVQQPNSPRDSPGREECPPGWAAAADESTDQGCTTAEDIVGGEGAGPLQPWLDLISVISHHLNLLREAHVPRILIRCLFKQTLSFVDVQLFNQLLLRPECCSTSNARYLIEGLQLLDSWLAGSGAPAAAVTAAGSAAAASGQAGLGPSAAVVTAGDDLLGQVDDLKHIRQAARFLVLANKGALRLDDFTTMCPALNMQQLYRLATTFWDDSPRPPPPPHQPLLHALPGGAPPAAAATGAAQPSDVESSAPAEPAAAAGEVEVVCGVSWGRGETEGNGSELTASTTAMGPGSGKGKMGEELGAAVGGDVQQPAEGEGVGPSDAVMEAAEAAVAAAAAAAAADEAGAVPAPPSEAVSRNVSGEVLEEMKRRHSVANNGGLIVTFLLDEDSVPLIVQGYGGGGGSSGGVSRQLLQVVNEPRLHEGLREGLPPALRSEDCPPQVFAFMIDEAAEA
ncbi:hypothetical protein VaNZ11_013808 [Volvox africanus]|uniref:Dilute domain-containing protein n=1 Tax=Volvox africanus TaxID=51714 RepID=A0ABQ5SIC7_9CHLO|nr:hypothetical protein VaNZ11_013808 [Volvox africanus]